MQSPSIKKYLAIAVLPLAMLAIQTNAQAVNTVEEVSLEIVPNSNSGELSTTNQANIQKATVQTTAQSSDGFTLPSAIANQKFTPKGSADFKRLMVKAVTIKLWEQADTSINPTQVLQTKFAYGVEDKYLVEAIIRGMLQRGIPRPRVGKWFWQIREFTPTVQKDDVITMVKTAQSVSFYHNGSYIGAINNPQFGDDFFGVWLAPDSKYPQIRSQLLQQ